MGVAVDAENQTRLETRLANEANQTVRFEIQLVLSRHAQGTSTGR